MPGALVACFLLLSGGHLLLASPLAVTAPLSAESLDEDRSKDGQIINTDNIKRPEPLQSESTPSGNPLWAIPLITLAETRERPLFAPSRRPPAPAVARAPAPPPRLPPMSAPPDVPHLTLVGTIVGSTEGFGLFLDPATKAVVRLKTGNAYQGWLLRTVREREVTLEKNYLSTTLSLPAHDSKETTGSQANGAQPRRQVDGPAFAR